jgi:prephenate dehydratase
VNGGDLIAQHPDRPRSFRIKTTLDQYARPRLSLIKLLKKIFMIKAAPNQKEHPMNSSPRRIAFQGELGANSHIACRDAYPDYEAVACPTFEDAFQAVRDGAASLGMIPIENSVAGRVADIHHLLPLSGLHIVGEYFLPVSHSLVRPKGATLETLKTVTSHPQALGQCRETLRKMGLEAVVGADTAGSARMCPKPTIRRAARCPRRWPQRSMGSMCSRPIWKTKSTTRRALS